jgi:hypothetical protein
MRKTSAVSEWEMHAPKPPASKVIHLDDMRPKETLSQTWERLVREGKKPHSIELVLKCRLTSKRVNQVAETGGTRLATAVLGDLGMSDRERIKRLGLERVPEKDLPEALRQLESKIQAERDSQKMLDLQRTGAGGTSFANGADCETSPAMHKPGTFNAAKAREALARMGEAVRMGPQSQPATPASGASIGTEKRLNLQAWWRSLPQHRQGMCYLIAMLAAGILLAVLHRPHGTKPIYDESLHAYTFNELRCSDNCSEQVQGYQWASEQGIDDSSDCAGKHSKEFLDGCRVWAEESQQLSEEINAPPDDGG